MRDMENRCPIGDRKIDGLKEVENETWGQTKQILKSMISENLEIEDVNTERAHQVGNTNNTLPRTAITKPSSIKVKQIVLSAAKKFKEQKTLTKTSLRRRWILGKRNGNQ